MNKRTRLTEPEESPVYTATDVLRNIISYAPFKAIHSLLSTDKKINEICQDVLTDNYTVRSHLANKRVQDIPASTLRKLVQKNSPDDFRRVLLGRDLNKGRETFLMKNIAPDEWRHLTHQDNELFNDLIQIFDNLVTARLLREAFSLGYGLAISSYTVPLDFPLLKIHPAAKKSVFKAAAKIVAPGIAHHVFGRRVLKYHFKWTNQPVERENFVDCVKLSMSENNHCYIQKLIETGHELTPEEFLMLSGYHTLDVPLSRFVPKTQGFVETIFAGHGGNTIYAIYHITKHFGYISEENSTKALAAFFNAASKCDDLIKEILGFAPELSEEIQKLHIAMAVSMNRPWVVLGTKGYKPVKRSTFHITVDHSQHNLMEVAPSDFLEGNITYEIEFE